MRLDGRLPACTLCGSRRSISAAGVPLDGYVPRIEALTGEYYGESHAPLPPALRLKQAILAAFANDMYLKYVVCFDTVIDIENGAQMAWAQGRTVLAN